mgnify:CR=1 FL=1
MSDWFTVERTDEQTFAISEYKHPEETHCYLLIGTDKALLIDTGLGVANIGEAVRAITDKPILAATTHVHWDHIGGHKYFKDFAVFEAEKDWLKKFPLSLSTVKANLIKEPCDFPAEFKIEEYRIYGGEPALVLKDGDVIDIGNRQIQVIHTPGHSLGHVCFYEKERGCLYSGDLVYEGCLDAFYPSTDPALFMSSVGKISALPIKKIFPGHHRLDIPVGFIGEIYSGFKKIQSEGRLKHGGGIFSFEHFQIHI